MAYEKAFSAVPGSYAMQAYDARYRDTLLERWLADGPF